MKKIQNTNVSSEKTNGKATLWVSIIIMVLVWLVLAAFLTLILLEAIALLVAWNLLSLAFVGFLFVIVVYLVPLQLIRYIRKLRKLISK
jgi:hypothetical protein